MAEQQTKGLDEKFCTSCGQVINILAEICPECGVRQMQPPGVGDDVVVPMLLNGLLGHLGFMGIGHLAVGSVAKGIALLCFGLALTLIRIVDVADFESLDFGIGFILFRFVYTVVFAIVLIWSIFDVRSVVRRKSQR